MPSPRPGAQLPIRSWCQDLEPDCQKQIENAARLPFGFSHVALMADAHLGVGVPIGAVLALQGFVIPHAVGVDIGCGLHAVQLPVMANELSRDLIMALLSKIRHVIPLGFEHQKSACPSEYMPEVRAVKALAGRKAIVVREWTKAQRQLGTLGGGNHFIELQKDEEQRLWLMIHSGSRNLGLQVAEHYNQLAQKLNRQHHYCDEGLRLAPLDLKSAEGMAYWSEMEFCLEFARMNRQLMVDRICQILFNELGVQRISAEVKIHHNFAAREEHFGVSVIVHRKGATRATQGERGVIPGSQGSASYIVEGLGNVSSFKSCAHGAGRRLSRTAAIKTLDLQHEVALLERQQIVHALRGRNDLEEAPSAYKDIEAVMAAQSDLVKIVHRLTPLAVIKG